MPHLQFVEEFIRHEAIVGMTNALHETKAHILETVESLDPGELSPRLKRVERARHELSDNPGPRALRVAIEALPFSSDRILDLAETLQTYGDQLLATMPVGYHRLPMEEKRKVGAQVARQLANSGTAAPSPPKDPEEVDCFGTFVSLFVEYFLKLVLVITADVFAVRGASRNQAILITTLAVIDAFLESIAFFLSVMAAAINLLLCRNDAVTA